MPRPMRPATGACCVTRASQIPIEPAEPGAPLPATSFPGGFRTPALRACATVGAGPAFETRHTCGLTRRSKRRLLVAFLPFSCPPASLVAFAFARSSSQPSGRDLQFAVYSLGSQDVVDSSAEFIRDQTPDHAGPISGGRGGHDGRSSSLAPLKYQAVSRPSIRTPMPANRYPAGTARKCSVLRSVGGQLMKNDCHRLYRIGAHIDSRPIDQRIAIPHAGRKFATNELGEVNATPSIDAQQGMCIRQ